MANSDKPRVIIADQQQPRRFTIGIGVLREYGIILAFLAVFATLSFLTPAFFTVRNMLNVLDQSAQVGLVALGRSRPIGAGRPRCLRCNGDDHRRGL
jgi:ABC-type xylose transport system permease subunit